MPKIEYTLRRNKRARAGALAMDAASGRTEAANAKRLISQHGETLRYATEWGEWAAWDGRRWKRDSGMLVQAHAKDVASGLWDEVKRSSEMMRKIMIPFAAASNSVRGINAMIALARSEKGIPISVADLDQEPWLLNCANGTVDLRTGELKDHDPADYITKITAAAYIPDAACPKFEQFLMDVFEGNEALIQYLQRAFGYGLTGDVSEQMLLILWGDGSNGKSTLVETLLNVVGQEYGGSPPRSLFSVSQFDRHPAELMTLQGKRLMITQETEQGAQLAEAQIKYLTGGDTITGRGMYENFRSFTPTHKLMLCTNHKPEVRGTDYAIWRRLKLVPFKVKFEGSRVDRKMGQKLKAEAAGILAWMVRGCLDWLKNGMNEPDDVLIATEEYAIEQDEVGRFIKECCECGDKYETEASVLYAAFQREMPDSQRKQTAFGRTLSEKGFTKGQMTSGPRKGRKTWKGIRLVGAGGFSKYRAVAG